MIPKKGAAPGAPTPRAAKGPEIAPPGPPIVPRAGRRRNFRGLTPIGGAL